VGRGTRHDLVAFVNARPVDSRTINGSLLEAYREYLPEGRFPVAFVFLECPPADVDVNVHPAKREVRFRREAVVRGFLIRAVLGRLRESQAPVLTSSADPFTITPERPVRLPAPFHPWVSEPPPPYFSPPAAAAPPPPPPAELSPGWKFLGTAHGSYALFETPGGLVLLDRRAAHERVWYERLREQFRAGGVPVQRLLLALSLELSPVAAAVLTEHLAFLRGSGFEVEEFGRNFFRVDALPAWMEPGDAESFLRDLVGALREGRLPAGDLDLARDELARLAAAKAVRLPGATTEREALGLLRDLFDTTSPGTAPGGRPTFVELNHGELARRFQK
jgi:DNA mismatch repair protein MutL